MFRGLLELWRQVSNLPIPFISPNRQVGNLPPHTVCADGNHLSELPVHCSQTLDGGQRTSGSFFMLTTIHTAAHALQTDRTSPQDLLDACLCKSRAMKRRVRAWVLVDRDQARADAAARLPS